MQSPVESTKALGSNPTQGPSSPAPLVYSTDEAAKILGISKRHLCYLMARKKIAYLKLGKVVKFLMRDIEAYLRRSRVNAAGE